MPFTRIKYIEDARIALNGLEDSLIDPTSEQTYFIEVIRKALTEFRIREKGYCIADPAYKMTLIQIRERVKELSEQNKGIDFHFDGDERMILGKFKEGNIENELKQWDINVQHELFYDDENDKEVGKYFLMTVDDPSVGIFGVQLSPAYEDLEMLKEWWKANKDKIIEELKKDDPDWKKIDFNSRK